MIRSSWQQAISLDTPAQLAIAGFLGLLLGSLFAFLSPNAVLWLVLLVVMVLVAIRRPEVAVLGIIVMLSTVFSDVVFPRISIGIGNLYITDIIIIALFALIILRWLVDKKFQLVHTPLDLPLVLFVAWAVITAVRGYLEFNTDFVYFVPEVRIVAYYSIFFLVTQLITRGRNLDVFIKWFFMLATVVAVAIIVQYWLGVTFPFLAGRVETLATQGRTFQEVTRVTDTVGEGLLTIAFIAKTIALFTNRLRSAQLVDLVQWAVLAIGLAMTFNRTHWGIALLAFLLTALLSRRQVRQTVLRWFLVCLYVFPALLTLILLAGPADGISRFVTASFDRLASSVSPDLYREESTSTLLWRRFEFQYGLPQLASQPLMGIGLGARYRPTLAQIDTPAFDGRRYTHNAHLWIAMKTGLVGYFLWAWLSIVFIWRGIKYWRLIADPQLRAIVLSFSLAYLGVMVGCILHPIVMTLYWVPVLAAMMGINEVIIRGRTAVDRRCWMA
jgi:O-antigen ligase